MGIINTSTSNCTLPPEGANFVSAPNIRGTLEIVWSCASILLLCTYKVLHQNVPLQSTPDPQKWKEGLYRTYYRTRDKLGWMVLNLVAPEYILAKAWSDHRSAKLAQAKMEKWAAIDGVPWTITHTHFANLGGFAIKFRHLNSSPEPSRNYDDLPHEYYADDPNSEYNRIHHGRPAVPVESSILGQIHPRNNFPTEIIEDLSQQIYYTCEGFLESIQSWSGLIGEVDWNLDETNARLMWNALAWEDYYEFKPGEHRRFVSGWLSWYRNLRALQGDVWILDAHQLCLARELGIISKLPAVTQDDLSDRNKGDIFTTMVALFQFGWFIVQLIVRLCQRKSISQLEVMTVSFAVITAMTYSLLWGRPKDIMRSIILPANQHPQSKEDLIRLALHGPYQLLPQGFSRKTLLQPWRLWPYINLTYIAQSLCFILCSFDLYRFIPQIWCPGRLFDYINTLGISNFDVHIDQDLETEGAHFSTNAIYAGGVGLVVFGAIWGFTFPTTVELWLWRISSAVAVAVPTFGMLFHLANAHVLHHLVRYNSDEGPGTSSRRTRIMLFLWRAMWFLKRKALVNAWALLIYSLSRGFIVVEVFRSLAFQPPGTFQTSWPANLPHIG